MKKNQIQIRPPFYCEFEDVFYSVAGSHLACEAEMKQIRTYCSEEEIIAIRNGEGGN